MANYKKSDGWILHSIFGKSSLKDIISTGDHFNHAIFNYDELNDGLNRLITNGYVVKKGKYYHLTRKSKALTPVKFGIFRPRGSIEHMFYLMDLLPTMTIEIEKNDSRNFISYEDFQKAVDEYTRHMERIFRLLSK
jgi:hypothetical protein